MVIDGQVTLKAELDGDGLVTGISEPKGTASVKITGLESGEYSVVEPADAAAVKGLEKLTDDAAGTVTHVLVDKDGVAVAVSEDGEEWFAVSDIDFTADSDTNLAANLKADAEAVL